jgi:hypothetical protein
MLRELDSASRVDDRSRLSDHTAVTGYKNFSRGKPLPALFPPAQYIQHQRKKIEGKDDVICCNGWRKKGQTNYRNYEIEPRRKQEVQARAETKENASEAIRGLTFTTG